MNDTTHEEALKEALRIGASIAKLQGFIYKTQVWGLHLWDFRPNEEVVIKIVGTPLLSGERWITNEQLNLRVGDTLSVFMTQDGHVCLSVDYNGPALAGYHEDWQGFVMSDSVREALSNSHWYVVYYHKADDVFQNLP